MTILLPRPNPVVGANGLEVMKARWLDVAAGEFLTVGQIGARNPGTHSLYRREREATPSEMKQIGAHLVTHRLPPIRSARVGLEAVTGRLLAAIPASDHSTAPSKPQDSKAARIVPTAPTPTPTH